MSLMGGVHKKITAIGEKNVAKVRKSIAPIIQSTSSAVGLPMPSELKGQPGSLANSQNPATVRRVARELERGTSR